jgi:hypothetical protein
MDTTAGLVALEEEKSLAPAGIRNRIQTPSSPQLHT